MLTLVMWLCATNNGTILGRLLSWSGFRPLSRVTYSTYLTHSWVLWVALGTRRELIDLKVRYRSCPTKQKLNRISAIGL